MFNLNIFAAFTGSVKEIIMCSIFLTFSFQVNASVDLYTFNAKCIEQFSEPIKVALVVNDSNSLDNTTQVWVSNNSFQLNTVNYPEDIYVTNIDYQPKQNDNFLVNTKTLLQTAIIGISNKEGREYYSNSFVIISKVLLDSNYLLSHLVYNPKEGLLNNDNIAVT